MNRVNLDEISEAIALAGLKIGAIKIRPENPFLWASGTYNPIYNDNRMFLFYPGYRKLIANGFAEIIYGFDLHMKSNLIIAGTSTAGIAPGTTLASILNLPFIYIRDKPKDHGLRNQIEGIDAENSLKGFHVILIEDLISTDGSSVAAVAAIRNANGFCNLCLSIFNYGLSNPPKMFAGEIPYNNNGDRLQNGCEVKSLLSYTKLLSVGIKNGFIKNAEREILLEWMNDQPNWGENHGFPPIQK